MLAPAVYLLCSLTSIVCMLLLSHQFIQTRSRLLFWSALGFTGFAINNLLLFIDLVIFPTEIDLRLPRLIASGVGAVLLLSGLIWETDQ